MEDCKMGPGPLEDSEPHAGATGSAREGDYYPQVVGAERVRKRVARAKLIEQTTYRLTDLLTIISGRIEILSEKVPVPCKAELLAIRIELKKGVELNERFLLAAQACQREAD